MNKFLYAILSFSLCVSLVLSGCSSKNSVVTFKGESKNWSVVYSMYITNNSHTGSEFTLKYKGSDISNVGNVEYVINGPTEGQSGQSTVNNNGEASIKIKELGGMPEKNGLINVKISWDNKNELIGLTKK